MAVFFGVACEDGAQDEASPSPSMPAFPEECHVSPADAGCTDCIQLSSVATLGRDRGEGYLEDSGTIADVVRDSSGSLWVGQRDRIKVFDSSGQYLRTVGGPGEGPGEYVFAQPRLVDSSGNIHVMDVRQFRVTALSAGGDVVETWRLPFPTQHAAFFADGNRLLAAAWAASPELLDSPLHVVSSDGEVLRSFGAQDGVAVSREAAERRVAVDPQGTLISAGIGEYRIDIWTQDGEKLSTIIGPS